MQRREGQNDTPFSFQSEQTVGKHKCCLWFKAQANRRGDRALCLLSALQLESKTIQMKGGAIQMTVLSMSIKLHFPMSKTYLILKCCDCDTSAEHTHTEKNKVINKVNKVVISYRDNSIFRHPPNQSNPILTQIQ